MPSIRRIKTYLKQKLPPAQVRRLWRLYEEIKALPFSNNLNKLALIYMTDKWGSHFYTPHYNEHFQKFKKQKINLLEIGVGGYEDPNTGGHSLRMWKKYFPKANIYSIDIYDKSSLQERRLKIFQGSQDDEEFLKNVCSEIGEIHIVIDDGSHQNDHIIKSFEILFPLLKEGGVYVVEDIQTSYWPSLGGDSVNLDHSNNAINFFKRLIDGLNYEEFVRPDYIPSYYETNIISIHFYHNLVFIYKGDNTEGSTLRKNNITYKGRTEP